MTGGKIITCIFIYCTIITNNATDQFSKVSRIFFDSKLTKDKLQHLNIDGGVRVVLSGK